MTVSFRKILPYAVIVVLLLIGGFGAFAYQRWQVRKSDSETTATARQAAAKINKSISDSNYIPATMPVVNSAKSDAISYKKIDYASYQFCVTYKSGSLEKSSALSADKLSIPDQHAKGKNCQTIHPYVDPIQISGSTRICDLMVNKSSSVDHESSGQIGMLSAGPPGLATIALNPVKTGSTGPFTFTADDQIFNSRCARLGVYDLRVGQPIYVFTTDNNHIVAVQEKLNWH